MTRSLEPIIICDYEGGCGDEAPDYFEQCADTVGGVRITATTRHPGWVSTDGSDLCPEHARQAAPKPDVEGSDHG